jgi:hypothetical protein
MSPQLVHRPADYFEGKVMEELFAEERCEKFIRNVCRNFKLPFPRGFRRRLWREMMDQELESYGQGEAEDEDFLHLFNIIYMGDDDVEKEALDYVAGWVKPSGQYVEEMRHPTVLRGDRFEERPSKITVYRQPFNKALHQIGRQCDDTHIIKNKVDVKLFSDELQMSRYVTILSHVPPKLTANIDEIDLLTIRTKKKVFAVLPKVFPQILKSIGRALREFAVEQTIFAHKGNQMRQYCKDTFQWELMKVIDVFWVCLERGWGAKDSLDHIAADLVGGQFCRRGWRFEAVAIPSSTVLEHRELSVSLVHEFGVKLQEVEAGGVGHST